MRFVQGRSAACSAIVLGFVLVGCAAQTPPPPAAPVPPAPTPLPPPPPPPPKFVATPGLSPRERALTIVKLLNDGERDQAGAEAQQLLTEEPDNALAQSLFDQITKDPKVLFGDKNFRYTVQSGETLSTLAARYLGDRFLFYALARYNNIDKPSSVTVGQTILIPGIPTASRPSSARKRVETESDVEALEGRIGTKKAAKPPIAGPSPAPAPLHDPHRASVLRGQALVLLNGGAAGRAVSLLKEAARLDPDSALIRRDLAKAEQINAALHR